MTGINKKVSTPVSMPAEILTVFEVSDGGTLQMVDCDEAQSRAELYEGAADQWGSPQGLLDAADECQPLAWAVGRSNWLFFGSELAGERAAVVMSLLQSALCRARHSGG